MPYVYCELNNLFYRRHREEPNITEIITIPRSKQGLVRINGVNNNEISGEWLINEEYTEITADNSLTQVCDDFKASSFSITTLNISEDEAYITLTVKRNDISNRGLNKLNRRNYYSYISLFSVILFVIFTAMAMIGIIGPFTSFVGIVLSITGLLGAYLDCKGWEGKNVY